IVAGYREGQTRTIESAEIVGSLGTVRVEDVTRSAIFWTDDPDRREAFEPNLLPFDYSLDATIREHVDAFLRRILAGQPPPVPGVEGLRSLELVEAALRSRTPSLAGRP